eukprot:9521278-Ditylum_brightwellii.AAC.1
MKDGYTPEECMLSPSIIMFPVAGAASFRGSSMLLSRNDGDKNACIVAKHMHMAIQEREEGASMDDGDGVNKSLLSCKKNLMAEMEAAIE